MVSGAAIAYYTIFALPPLLVIVFFVASQFGVSEQKINEVVKEQLGLPTSAVSGAQGSEGSQRSSSGRSSAGSTSRREASADSSAVVSQGRAFAAGSLETSGTSSLLTPVAGVIASLASADPQPEPPPLPEQETRELPADVEAPVRAPDPEESAGAVPPAGPDQPGAPGAAPGTAQNPPPPAAVPPVGAARTSNAAGQTAPPEPAAQRQARPRRSAQSHTAAKPTNPQAPADAGGQQQQQQQSSASGGGSQPAGGSPSEDGGLGSVASRAQSQQSPVSGLGPISKIIGILVLVFSATGLFAQLQHALNRAWEVEPDPEQSGVWTFLFKRLLSLGMVAVLAFLLLVSLVLTTVVHEIVSLVTGGGTGVFAVVIGFVLNNLATLAIGTLLFAAMFKLLPDARMQWKDTWVGAFITAVLFVIGKSLLAWYLESSSIGSTWGAAAASMIALLVWVYYSSLIVLFGAELAQVWAQRYGQGIEPAKGAVRIIEEKRHLRGSPA